VVEVALVVVVDASVVESLFPAQAVSTPAIKIAKIGYLGFFMGYS
jgi:hypothetical protein